MQGVERVVVQQYPGCSLELESVEHAVPVGLVHLKLGVVIQESLFYLLVHLVQLQETLVFENTLYFLLVLALGHLAFSQGFLVGHEHHDAVPIVSIVLLTVQVLQNDSLVEILLDSWFGGDFSLESGHVVGESLERDEREEVLPVVVGERGVAGQVPVVDETEVEVVHEHESSLVDAHLAPVLVLFVVEALFLLEPGLVVGVLPFPEVVAPFVVLFLLLHLAFHPALLDLADQGHCLLVILGLADLGQVVPRAFQLLFPDEGLLEVRVAVRVVLVGIAEGPFDLFGLLLVLQLDLAKHLLLGHHSVLLPRPTTRGGAGGGEGGIRGGGTARHSIIQIQYKMNKDNQSRVVSEKDLKECISCLDMNENQLAVGLVDETVLVYSHTAEGLQQEEQALFRFKDNCLGVVDVKYDPEGKLLAVSCLDSTVRVYNTEEGALFSQVSAAPMENFKLAFHERHLVSAGEMGTVSLYDIETQEVVDSYKVADAFVLSLDTSPNGKYLALGNALGHVFTIDTEQKQTQKLECHGKQVRGVRFTQDGSRVITCSDDMHVNVIDVEQNQLQLTLTGHKSNINSVDTHPNDPNLFVTASFDRTVKLWDLRVNGAQQSLSSHNDNVWSAKFHSSGNLVASGGESGQLFIHSLV